jgi:16S rRNA (guanine527-N7)-methyltransferase
MEILLKYFSDFTPVQLQQFEALNELYHEWNSKINVISRKDMDGLYEKHVLHSLSIAAVFDFPDGLDIIDIGTGGGFPGVPLAIYFPGVQFHLVDSIGKKLKVVEDIASRIGLKNLTIQHIRAEDIKNRKFDFVVSRAVAPLKELWHWAKPLLKKCEYQLKDSNEGLRSGLVSLKGGDLTLEIAASGCRPTQLDIHDLFPEDYFSEKYILFVAK